MGMMDDPPWNPEYSERTPEDGKSASVLGSSRTSSRVQATYTLQMLYPRHYSDVVRDFLGDTQLDIGAGKLYRTLPRAHPLWPWLFAANISSLTGIGRYDARQNVDILQAPTIRGPDGGANYAFYNGHFVEGVDAILVGEFEPRPYPVLPDEAIRILQGSWINDAGTIDQQFQYADEWLRYVDWEEQAIADYATATQGQLVFRDTGAASGKHFVGMPRLLMPNSTIKMTWHEVPYRYVTSPDSYLNLYRGRINQQDWWNWRAGELLYIGYSARPYTPPVQRLYKPQQVEGNPNPNQAATFSWEKLCDVELVFIRTLRTCATAPDYDAPGWPNKNWLPKGHNLLPWYGDNRFHYATVDNADVSKQVPSYLSVPFQILFTDPDVPQADI